jgi:hypothetical protein
MWRVAENILNKQLRTAGKGWSSKLVVRRGLTTQLSQPGLLRNIRPIQSRELVGTVMNLHVP